MILHITNDLMMSSTARSHANSLNREIKFAADFASAVQALQQGEIQVCLADLQAAGMDVQKLAEAVAETNTPTVVYAQHVHVELLDAAKQLEFATVMTRGQFNKSLGQIISQTPA